MPLPSRTCGVLHLTAMSSPLSRRSALLMLASLAASRAIAHAQWDPARRYGPPRATRRLQIGGATLQVEFATGALDLSDDVVMKRIETAAHAVATYYGGFPVPRTRIFIVPVADRSGVVQGTTWGDVGGWPAFTRIRLGQHTSPQELAADWTITHELVHLAFPSLPDDQHWMEEGLATYIEPIARVQAGELPAKQIWSDMLDGMRKGRTATGRRGPRPHSHLGPHLLGRRALLPGGRCRDPRRNRQSQRSASTHSAPSLPPAAPSITIGR